ncbi:MAG: iojap protein [Bacteroidetes bacterium]|nr:iojap protein [Bacteroidota bacterium]
MAKTTKKAPAKTVKKTVAKAAPKTVKKAVKKTPAKTAKKVPVKAVKKAPAKVAVKKVKKAAPKKIATPKAAPKKAVKKVAVKAPAAKAPAAKKAIKTPTELLADAVVEGILDRKGKNITVMNLQSIHNRVCDYFIICQADSNTQVKAVADSIEEMVKKMTGDKPYRSEGFENAEWILIDFVTVVVHVFQSQIREFYNLESLWADAETTEIAFD